METTYTHLTLINRDRIKALYDDGFSLRKIGRTLGISHSTVSRELRRGRRSKRTQYGEPDSYEPLVAHHKAYIRRRYANYQGKKIETNKALRLYVITGLKAGWNPDEISGRMKRTRQPFYASKTTIYEWLYSFYGQAYCQYLPRARYRPKRRKHGLKPGLTISGRRPIAERPAGATNRSRYGHWEADTVVSGKYAHSTTSLVVATERKTRYVVAGLIPNLAGETFSGTLSQLLEDKYVRSMTLDNGVENHAHQAFTRATGAVTFFCDPYSSWQKGSVEHANKLIRGYIPKGSNLADYDQAYISYMLQRINNKPRRCLGYKSALELAAEKGVIARESGAVRG
jgi:IS30 family transposase